MKIPRTVKTAASHPPATFLESSGKKPGGLSGHEWTSLRMVTNTDVVEKTIHLFVLAVVKGRQWTDKLWRNVMALMAFI